jgi:hypothetical protein
MSDYEKFQQRIFDQLAEMEARERTRIVADLIAIGHRAGVDVVAEVLDKGKTLAEVLDAISASVGLTGFTTPS